MIAFDRSGIFDDDIAEELRHDFRITIILRGITADFCEEVPAIGIFGMNQVENPHGIAIFH